jgi:hypothetical protein
MLMAHHRARALLINACLSFLSDEEKKSEKTNLV